MEDITAETNAAETSGLPESPMQAPTAQEEWAHLRPDDTAEKVTPDGGVLKKVLEEGTGKKPGLHARCLVHYVGRLTNGGAVFYNTRKESENSSPVTVVAGRDAVKQEVGLNLAVATMSIGEKAVVYVEDPKYGWGEKGNFSFPSIPPNAQLSYELELLDFDDVDEDKEGRMLYEDKLEAAERRRKLGNDLFKEGKYKEALLKYAVALSYMDEDFMMQLEGFYLDKALAVTIPIQLNMAACQLKTGDYNTAIYNCGKVLEEQPGNVKALYRRAKARHALGQTEEALADLEEALKKDPNDQALLKELAAVKKTMREERKAEAQLFKGQFKAPKPTPATSDNIQTTPANAGITQMQISARTSFLQSIVAWLLGLLVLLRLRKPTATCNPQ